MTSTDWRCWPRLAVSPLIELAYNPGKKVVEVYVDGHRSLMCAALVASIDDLARKGKDITSIEEMADLPGVKLVECAAAADLFGTPEAELAAHASNIQTWIEHDYDTHLLHCNISFPLLVDLTRAGDDKARRVLEATIDERMRDGSSTTRKAIALMFGDFLSEAQWDRLLTDTVPEVNEKALECLPKNLFTPTMLARVIDDEKPGRWVLENLRLDIAFPEGSISRPHQEWLLEHYPKVAATYPFLAPDLIRVSVAECDKKIPGAIILHPNMPMDVIEMLALQDRPEILQIIARRDDLPQELVYKLLITGNEAIVREIMRYAIRDHVSNRIDLIKRALAETESTQKEILVHVLDKIRGSRELGLIPKDYWPAT